MKDEFEAVLPRLALLARWCEEHRAWHKVTLGDLAAFLSWRKTELWHLVDEVLGVKPDEWAEPETYSVETLLEACTRHEIAARY